METRKKRSLRLTIAAIRSKMKMRAVDGPGGFIMKLRLVFFIALFGLIAGAAFAHGDKKHVVGTVEKINPDSVVVKTTAPKSVEVKLTAATVYIIRANMADKPAKLSDLAVGDHVVIHATPEGDTLQANELKFSHVSPGAPAAASKPKS